MSSCYFYFLNRLWTSCCWYLQLQWWRGQTMRPHFSLASVPVGCHGIGRMALVGQQQPCLAGVRCIEWPCRRFSLPFPVACYCCYRKSRGRNRPRRWGVAAACLAGQAGWLLSPALTAVGWKWEWNKAWIAPKAFIDSPKYHFMPCPADRGQHRLVVSVV